MKRLSYKGKVYYLDDLPEHLKEVAIKNVLDINFAYVLRQIALEKLEVKKKLHSRINNPWRIKKHYQDLSYMHKCRRSKEMGYAFIRSNLCEFTERGEYLTYLIEDDNRNAEVFIASISGGN